MRRLNLDKHLKKHEHYAQLADNELGHIGCEIQKHIDWDQEVGYCYAPGDGVCIEIDAHLCPATRFFELMEFIGNDMIDEKTYLSNCI